MGGDDISGCIYRQAIGWLFRQSVCWVVPIFGHYIRIRNEAFEFVVRNQHSKNSRALHHVFTVIN